MTETEVVGIIKDIIIAVAVLGVTIYAGRVDKRAEAVWKWLTSHSHEVDCNQSECKPKVTGVLAPKL